MSNSEKILFQPFPKQMEFIEAVFSFAYNFILYGGAIRGGKTFALCAVFIMLARFFPGSKWVIIRRDLPTLKRTTIPSFWKVCPENFVKSYNQQDFTVIFKNGSQIMFMAESYDTDKDLNRFKGLECNGFGLEEINELQQATYLKCIERAGSHIIENQPKPTILATCNPTQNWVKTEFYDKYKLGTLPEKVKYIPSRIFDNPHIPKEYLESLKNLPKTEYSIFVDGNWEIKEKTGAEFYKSFNPDKTVKDCKSIYDPKEPLHITFDFNKHPYISLAIHCVKGSSAYQIDEIAGRPPFNLTEKVAELFCNEYKHHKGLIFVYGDPAGNRKGGSTTNIENDFDIIFRVLKSKGFIVRDKLSRSAPSVSMRGAFLNEIFENNFGGCEIFIDPVCFNTTTDYHNVIEDSDGTKLKKKVTDSKTKISYEPYGHFSDANDYFYTTIFQEAWRVFSQRDKSGSMIPIDIPISSQIY